MYSARNISLTRHPRVRGDPVGIAHKERNYWEISGYKSDQFGLNSSMSFNFQ